jgi:formylglycine-generating enzyme required for sulfatase activity
VRHFLVVARPSRLLLAFALAAGVGCTIYNSSLLLGGDGGGEGGGDGPLGDSPSGGSCKTGTHECKDNALSHCIAGKWVAEQMCSHGCAADGGCIENPSCEGGGPGADQTCGPKSNIDCCAALPVPGGTYLRSGADGEAAAVSTFGLDQFEVTVGRYRKFVNAGFGTQLHPPAEGSGANPHVPGSGWSSSWNTSLPSSTSSLETSFTCALDPTWTPSITNTDNLPMNCLTWYEAFAFCAWDGGRLPSEAEWNYAAAGGAQNRYYPWSNPPSSEYISPQYAIYDCTGHNGGPPDLGDAGDGGTILYCLLADILPVGSRPMGNGRWGHADLAGNMAEWTADWSTTYPTPCDNCEVTEAGPTEAGPERVYRGGGFYYPATELPTWYRLADSPGNRDDSYGVRCARD